MTLKEVASKYNDQKKCYRRNEGQNERRHEMNEEKMYLRDTHGFKEN
jgi:hypothetical protein